MPRRATAALAVLALVTLAGCGGFFGGFGGEDTPTPDVNDADLPPGVNETGLADPDALLSAHRESLSASGFVFEYDHRLIRREGKVGNASRSVAIDTAGQVRAAANLTAHRIRERRPAATTVAWYNGSVGVRRVERGGVSYESYAPGPNPELSTHYILDRFLTTDGWRLVDVREDGQRFVLRLETTFDRPPGNTPLDERTVTVSARMVVDETGRIRRLNGTINDTTRGTFEGDRYVDTSVRRLEYELLTVGEVSVERPDWFEEAREAGAVDGADDDDG